MVKLDRYQRVVFAAAAVVVGLSTASLIVADGFYGVMWIGGVLLTVALLMGNVWNGWTAFDEAEACEERRQYACC